MTKNNQNNQNNQATTERLAKMLDKRREAYLREAKNARKGNEGRLYAHAHNCLIRAGQVLVVKAALLEGKHTTYAGLLKGLDKERARLARWAREDAKTGDASLPRAADYMTKSWEINACMELITAELEK